jgi:hypothetical protein
MSIVGLIVFLIIVGLLFWVVRALSGAFGIPAPIVQVIYVILVVVCVLWLLSAFGLMGSGPVLRVN